MEPTVPFAMSTSQSLSRQPRHASACMAPLFISLVKNAANFGAFSATQESNRGKKYELTSLQKPPMVTKKRSRTEEETSASIVRSKEETPNIKSPAERSQPSRRVGRETDTLRQKRPSVVTHRVRLRFSQFAHPKAFEEIMTIPAEEVSAWVHGMIVRGIEMEVVLRKIASIKEK